MLRTRLRVRGVLLAATAASALLAACNYSSKEAPNSPLWGGYSSTATYAIASDVFLLSVDREGRPYLVISPPGERKATNRLYSAPQILDVSGTSEAQKNFVEGRYYNLKTTVVGVVQKGTNLKVVEVLKESAFSWFFGGSSITIVRAELLDGEHRGKIADIRDISIELPIADRKAVAYKPDPHFVRLAEQPKAQSSR